MVIAVDLPMQGDGAQASLETLRAIELVIEDAGGVAGRYPVEIRGYDNSTAEAGAWDDAACAANAAAHVAAADEVVVLGPFNSGCAKVQVPVLNMVPDGPLLMFSHANTNPGLLKPWEADEPAKYYPSGRASYGRITTSDDWQGVGLARYAKSDLGLARCVVLTDGATYGAGIASTFLAAAAEIGLETAGPLAWDPSASTYDDLFARVGASSPDCVVLAGIADNNGLALIRDKVAVLGDNETVKLLAPDGFSGFPDIEALPAAAGMYISFADVPLGAEFGSGSTGFLARYAARHGAEPTSSYASYGAAAAQYLLASIAASDGTRAGVLACALSGAIEIPADVSASGFRIRVDPEVHDALDKRVSIEQIRDGAEVWIDAWEQIADPIPPPDDGCPSAGGAGTSSL